MTETAPDRSGLPCEAGGKKLQAHKSDCYTAPEEADLKHGVHTCCLHTVLTPLALLMGYTYYALHKNARAEITSHILRPFTNSVDARSAFEARTGCFWQSRFG